ncbi:CaiB/BaiF CoA transferase family protein [Maliponia aquimaris]|uniref:Succinyl-CoA:(R)-benzylsuccinate CoA-transferase subunit BbsF n=1 Tax=Maliponia aquimaris TaxID=1673631 RepID=A0A238KBE1_9RHOB|nr:CaiB/BaiF CoA-transferase family protein [Maliponia aquimaris]SMX40159.1 Succinyl-CoA:(R)-benzylsuccinate CoA-transferase subunit BbsF [Maliponia aquimaris]
MLTGIRIVEFEALGPAPFAAMHLADLGAEVIVIQRKGGETNPAKQGPRLLDRGKRAIALDLKAPTDLDTARALIRSADGLIEGLRPGVMERLGLGPDDTRALNPGLVYGRMTGWGQHGPKARQAGHDLNYLGLSGALFYAGLPGQVPGVPPTLLGDIGAGALYLTVGLLAGLVQARATGRGTVVDAAIVDGAQHMMALLRSLGPQFDTGARGRSLLDGPHWSRCYVCACGGHMAVQCLEPKFYAQFLDTLGLGDDPGFARQFDTAQWPVLTARLAGIFAGQSRDHWAAQFDGSDACVAPVLSPDEAARDPHMVARGHGAGAALPAPRFDGAVSVPGPVPDPGHDGAAILRELREKGWL